MTIIILFIATMVSFLLGYRAGIVKGIRLTANLTTHRIFSRVHHSRNTYGLNI